jgi:hypothetical protein
MNPVKSKKLNLQVRTQLEQPMIESDLATVSTNLSDEDLSEVAAYGRTGCIAVNGNGRIVCAQGN